MEKIFDSTATEEEIAERLRDYVKEELATTDFVIRGGIRNETEKTYLGLREDVKPLTVFLTLLHDSNLEHTYSGIMYLETIGLCEIFNSESAETLFVWLTHHLVEYFISYHPELEDIKYLYQTNSKFVEAAPFLAHSKVLGEGGGVVVH